MIRIFLLLYCSVLLSASTISTIELDYSDESMDEFTLSYFIDKNGSSTLEEMQNRDFSLVDSTHSFSGKIESIWYKVHFKNSTSIDKTIFLHNKYAYYSKEIDIFELSNNVLYDQHRYNILKDSGSNKLFGATLVHEITIGPKQSVDVFIRSKPMVSNLFNLSIYGQKSSINAIIYEQLYSIMIVSIMLTLALYNASLYLFNRRKEFLLYALYMLTPSIGLLYKYGIVFSHFQLYGEMTYWLNLTAILMPAFLIIFLKQLLQTHKMEKKIDYLLNGILVIIALNILTAFVIDLTFAMELFKMMFFLTMGVVIYLGYYLVKISHPLAFIFILAYSLYLAGMIITILGMSGILELNFFTFHSGGIGLILEGLLFSYLMHYNVKLLEKKVRDQKKLIVSKNKKAQLGDMIHAITHQWKQPLSRITSITSLVEFKIGQKSEISTEELHEKISSINADILFLSETIDDFRDFFSPNNTPSICDISEVITRAVSLSNDDTMSKQIEISTDLNFDGEILTFKNELLHIILNIIQNSKEAFKNSASTLKVIKIFGYSENDKTYIDIIDNAGGIDSDSLPYIFKEHYTTKSKKSGTGLGLYISKVILEDHLKGSIEVKNTKDGARFRIIF